jgi:hypothetical protein
MNGPTILGRTAGLLALAIGLAGLVLVVGPGLSATSHGVYLAGDADPLGSMCWLYGLTGIRCPMCGMLRSLIAVLHGDLCASVTFHPAGPLMAGALVGAAAAFVWRAKAKALRWLQAGTALAVLTGALRWMM